MDMSMLCKKQTRLRETYAQSLVRKVAWSFR